MIQKKALLNNFEQKDGKSFIFVKGKLREYDMISYFIRDMYLVKKKNKPLKSVLMFDPKGGFGTTKKVEELLLLKGSTDRRVFAFYLRHFLQTSTLNASLDDMVKLYEGLSKKDLMYKNEIRKYNQLPEEITVWRGTANPGEKEPRMCWSIDSEVARRFAKAHLFKAVILKNEIIAYYCVNADEDEIVVRVPEERVEVVF